MKFLRTLCLSAALCLAAPLTSKAQFFGGIAGGANTSVITYLVGTNVFAAGISATSTNFVLPGVTNATSTVIDCYNMRNVPLSLSAAGSGAVSLGYARSIDGVHWDTTNFVLLTLTATNPTGPLVSTNVDVGGFRYIAPMMFTNAATISNLVAMYGTKPGY